MNLQTANIESWAVLPAIESTPSRACGEGPEILVEWACSHLLACALPCPGHRKRVSFNHPYSVAALWFGPLGMVGLRRQRSLEDR